MRYTKYCNMLVLGVFLPCLLNLQGQQVVITTLRLDALSPVQSAPVVVSLSFRASVPVTIDLGEDRVAGVVFTIKDPAGGIKDQRLSPRKGLQRLSQVRLNSTSPYEQVFVLPAAWFIEAGLYSVKVRIPVEKSMSIAYREDETLDVAISSYSPSAMREYCSILSNLLSQTNAAERTIPLSRAISGIRDPVVLPYLVSNLGHAQGVDWELVAGIERLGTPEAVAALNQAMHSAMPDLAAAARTSLSRISVQRECNSACYAARNALTEEHK